MHSWLKLFQLPNLEAFSFSDPLLNLCSEFTSLLSRSFPTGLLTLPLTCAPSPQWLFDFHFWQSTHLWHLQWYLYMWFSFVNSKLATTEKRRQRTRYYDRNKCPNATNKSQYKIAEFSSWETFQGIWKQSGKKHWLDEKN